MIARDVGVYYSHAWYLLNAQIVPLCGALCVHPAQTLRGPDRVYCGRGWVGESCFSVTVL